MKMYPIEIGFDCENITIEQYMDGTTESVTISHEQVELICEWLKKIVKESQFKE
jgi:hypothetical protein